MNQWLLGAETYYLKLVLEEIFLVGKLAVKAEEALLVGGEGLAELAMACTWVSGCVR